MPWRAGGLPLLIYTAPVGAPIKTPPPGLVNFRNPLNGITLP